MMVAMEVAVRRVSPGEWEALRAVRLAALADAPHAFASTHASEADWGDERWRDRAETGSIGDRVAMYLAWLGDRAVGLAGGYRPAERSVVELVSMWTDASARRSGVGRELATAVVGWAEETGADVVELWVTDGNDAARELYASIGFRLVGDHQPLPSDPCKDEIRMRLRLDDR